MAFSSLARVAVQPMTSSAYRTFPVVITASLILLQLVSLSIVQTDAAACQFPSFVQTNRSSSGGSRRAQHNQHSQTDDPGGDILPPRDWVTRVRDQFTEFDHQVIISDNVIRTIPRAVGSVPSSVSSGQRRGGGVRGASSLSAVVHTRVCVQVVQGDRYLVAHEEPGQKGSRYTCLQFVVRSPEVVQVREASIGDRIDRTMCRNASLRLDRWLMLDRSSLGAKSSVSSRVPCPLVGGFSTHIFDKSRNEGVCDAYLGETRIESECQRGDGLTFRFRRQTCVPQDMYMHSTQPVTCLVTWTEAATPPPSGFSSVHRFTLLRHAETQHSYYWLLRTPAAVQTSVRSGGNQFAVYLFKDLVADTSHAVNETRNYVRFDAVRDQPRSSSEICSDEYEICSDLAGTGQASSVVQSRCSGVGVGSSGIDIRLTCPLTCGLCNASRPARCNLPPTWAGRWRTRTSLARHGGGSATTMIVNSTTITSTTRDADNESWNCVEWQSNSNASSNEVMLVTDFDNGCRQRFRCVRVVRQTAALVYLHFSRSAVWPLVRSGRDPVDCRAFRFDPPPSTTDGVDSTPSSESGSFMAALYGDGEVACDASFGDLVGFAILSSSYNVEYPHTNSSCTGSLTPVGGVARLQLDVRCTQNDDVSLLPVGLKHGSTSYACLDSWRSLTSAPSGGAAQVVITTRLYSPDDVASFAEDSESGRTLICWLITTVGPLQSFQMFVGSQCDAVVLRSSSPLTPRPRPPSADLPLPSTATFVRTFSSSTTVESTTGVVSQSSSPTARRTGRSTRPPKTTLLVAATLDQSTRPQSGSPETDTLPSPVIQSSTTASRDVIETDVIETAAPSENAIAVAAVVFLLAVIQAVAFCRC